MEFRKRFRVNQRGDGRQDYGLLAQLKSIPRAVGSVSPTSRVKASRGALGGLLANILSVGISLFLRYALLQAYLALLFGTLRAGTNPEA